MAPESVSERNVEETTLYQKTNYLASQDVSEILHRSYQVSKFNWTTVNARASSLLVLRAPHVVLAQSWVANVLKAYAFFRCSGVEFTFKIQSTSMHQGALMITHVFNEAAVDPDTFRGSFERRLNNRPLLFSAMPGNSQSLTIPWNNPVQWAPVDDALNDSFNMGVIDVDVLCPLSLASTTALDVEITVFATLIDPEVMGPVPYILQGNDDPIQESISKVTSGVEDFASSAASTAASVVSLASSLAPMASLVLDKPPTVSTAQPVVRQFGPSQLQTTGVDDVKVMGVSQTSYLTQQKGVMGDDVPNPTLRGVLQTPGHLFDEFLTETTPQFGWYVDPITYSKPLTIPRYSLPFLAYGSLPFSYWRGSITYQIFFFASTFVSARVRLTWIPRATGLTDLTVGGPQQGNVISKVVEIRGDTHTTVTIPYAKPELWSVIRNPEESATQDRVNGFFQMDLISISSIGPSPKVNFVAYTHAGPDYSVAGFQEYLVPSNYYFMQGAEEEKGVSAAVWEYSTVHDPIIESTGLEVGGYAQPEMYEDVCTLLKRPHYLSVVSGINAQQPLPPIRGINLVDNGSRDPTSFLMSMFRYWRGSVNLYVIRKATEANKPWEFQYPIEKTGTGNLTVIDNPGTFDLTARFNLPWFSQYPFARTSKTTARVAGVIPDPTTVDSMLYSMGDDVGLSGLFSPPIMTTTV